MNSDFYVAIFFFEGNIISHYHSWKATIFRAEDLVFIITTNDKICGTIIVALTSMIRFLV